MTKDDEIKVREMIRSIVDKELKSQKEDFDKQIVKTTKEIEKTQKDEFLFSLKKEISALDTKFLTKQQIKDLMVKAFTRQHRFMWEKTKFLNSYFNEL